MTISVGTRFGPYEIVAPIGAGGMGEVYRGRDTRLDRTVAIKILPAELAQDAKFRIRFEREAKVISSLNHPHICALYDVGPDYLVMEHCEGETLAKRIEEGALSTKQALEYGTQIADALDKAHRQGIIHRDLKPSNIMLTKAGVKLLDFGLAKQHSDSKPEESTIARVTEEGYILGTIQYMAPELFQGREADARSDIFALGLVLYEMVTGKPAFAGTSKASLIAAILEHEPEPLKPTTPPALDSLIRACLEKDPDERIQTAHDVKLQLRSVSEVGTSKEHVPPAVEN
jgi:serine/threonine protein kinase